MGNIFLLSVDEAGWSEEPSEKTSTVHSLYISQWEDKGMTSWTFGADGAWETAGGAVCIQTWTPEPMCELSLQPSAQQRTYLRRQIGYWGNKSRAMWYESHYLLLLSKQWENIICKYSFTVMWGKESFFLLLKLWKGTHGDKWKCIMNFSFGLLLLHLLKVGLMWNRPGSPCSSPTGTDHTQ